MDFMIFDSAGNAVESFRSEAEACRALLAMTKTDPSAPVHLAVLAFDDDGEAVGDPLTVADIRPEAATRLVLFGGDWLRRGNTVSRWSDSAAAAAPREVLGAS